MISISKKDLQHLEAFTRVNLIHSLLGYKSPVLIATRDSMGNNNLAIFNSLIHIGSNPPLLGIKFRPQDESKHTFSNLKQSGFCTLNLVSEKIFRHAHRTSARLPKGSSEFSFSGLTAIQRNDFKAPFVKESMLQIAATYADHYHVQINNTILAVVQVEAIFTIEKALAEDGHLDHQKLKTVANNGLYEYYQGQKLEKLEYVHIPQKD